MPIEVPAGCSKRPSSEAAVRSAIMRFTTCRIMHVKFVNGREAVSTQCLRSVRAGEPVSRQCLEGEA